MNEQTNGQSSFELPAQNYRATQYHIKKESARKEFIYQLQTLKMN